MNLLQKKLLDLFKKVIVLLKENNIEYQAVGGTAIGALREGGFIPWDDDIDIAIKYSDYKKLITLLRQSPDFEIENKESKQLFPYIKIFDKNIKISELEQETNLFIDVFFLWNKKDEPGINKALKKNKKRFHFISMEYWSYKRHKYLIGSFKAIFVKLAGLFVFKKSFKTHTKMLRTINQVKNISNDDYWYDYCQVNESIFKYKFNNIREYKFEDTKISVSKSFGLDNKHMYGDIMKRPKKDEQINHDIKLI